METGLFVHALTFHPLGSDRGRGCTAYVGAAFLPEDACAR